MKIPTQTPKIERLDNDNNLEIVENKINQNEINEKNNIENNNNNENNINIIEENEKPKKSYIIKKDNDKNLKKDLISNEQNKIDNSNSLSKNINNYSDNIMITSSGEIILKDKNNKKNKNININTKITSYSLIKFPSLRYKFLLMCFIWFITSCIYNGLIIAIKWLPGNIYINGILLYGVEIISYILCGIMIDWNLLGRKKTAILTLFITGIFLIFLIIYEKNKKLSILFYLLVRLFITIPFTEFYTYCLEIYPTSVRSFGFGINAGFNQIGGIIIPIILELVDNKIIYIIFSFFSFICSFLFFFLEETVNQSINETIKEIEEQKKIDFEKKYYSEK